MPAAAVIPAPIAYIKVVAVKTLVVEFCCAITEYLFGISLVSGNILSGVCYNFTVVVCLELLL